MAITVSDKAARKVKEIINDNSITDKVYLRLSVVGGGCSGFQHKLDLDPNLNEKLDEVFQLNGVDIVVDKRSLMYLGDALVDYHDEDLAKTGFSVVNPNAKRTCGCGSSFSM